MTGYDLAVIGAGPAGIAATVMAAGGGLRVALVDAAPRLGGQFHRHFDTAPAALRDIAALVRSGVVDHLAEHRVWAVERTAEGFAVHGLVGERSPSNVTVRARFLVIATGAYDRQLPFPGWDLPGVLTAGGAQALLKGNRVLAGQRVVVAGSGPFLLPVAAGLAAAGAHLAGVYEASRPTGFVRHPAAVLGSPGKLVEAAGYATGLLRHGVVCRTGRAVIAAHGDGRLEAVAVAVLDRSGRVTPGSARRVDCDALAIGYGFTPQVELLLQLGCTTRTDADGSLVTEVDDAQRTSQPGVYAAGEVTGVGGAELARVEGELAGLAVLADAGRHRPTPASLGRRRVDLLKRRGYLRRRRAALRRFAAALHAVYRPPAGWPDWLDGDTVVCRCEEVPATRLQYAVEQLGATDARSVKLLTRAGMGRCQGRVCGYAAACLAAHAAGRDVTASDLAGLAGRPLAQPVPLGLLAETAGTPETAGTSAGSDHVTSH
jgi:NADPH-dependent 2,4-dienoyl-CoA reductase/sulfur reductase-like enzyme